MSMAFYFGIGVICGAIMFGCWNKPSFPAEPSAQKVDFPNTDGFDFPVGAPDAKGYYNAQKFGQNNHLGDDWNGVGGGNSDLGDTIFATANGVCSEAVNFYGGWGKVIRIQHQTNSFEKYESLYAHMQSILVQKGDTIYRGQPIGAMGTAEGVYLAHLHFEIRDRWNHKLGGG